MSDASKGPPFTDHLVNVKHGVELKLRLWPAPRPVGPWVFWIHGGGFTAGYMHSIPRWVIPGFHAKGYSIVSIGYRLAPHVGIEDQLEDVVDCYTWCRANLSSLVSGTDIDAVVSAGDSAGGTLASLCGFHLSPPPRAIINLYGPTLLSHPHFHVPVPAPDAEQLLVSAQPAPYAVRTETDLRALWSARDPTQAATLMPWWQDLDMPLQDLRSRLALPDYTVGEQEKMRMDLYRWMSIRKNRFACVFRKETCRDEQDWQERLDRYSAIKLLEHVERYPPTFLLHGTEDTAAPIGPSRLFHDALKVKGVPTRARWVEGAEHSFDVMIESPADKGWEDIQYCIDWIDVQVQG